MTFHKTTKIDKKTGKPIWQCIYCRLTIPSDREGVGCFCSGIKGLGDAVHYGLAAIGIKSRGCGGCSKRRVILNRLVPFRKKPAGKG